MIAAIAHIFYFIELLLASILTLSLRNYDVINRLSAELINFLTKNRN